VLLLRIFKIFQIYTGKWLQEMSLSCLSGLSVLEFLSSSDSKGFCIFRSIPFCETTETGLFSKSINLILGS